MAILVADINLVGSQVLEALQACPEGARYTFAIGTNSEFKILQEIKDRILLVDQALCLDIMSDPGHWYAATFMDLSSTEYGSGDMIAAHIGYSGDVQVSIDSTYKPGLIAKSRDEVLRMIDLEDLYGGKSRYYFIENGFCYHCGSKLKGHFHVFEKTAICQSPQVYEDVLIYGAISTSEKLDAADPFFRKYDGLYQSARGMAKAGAEFLPPAEQIEAMRKTA